MEKVPAVNPTDVIRSNKAIGDVAIVALGAKSRIEDADGVPLKAICGNTRPLALEIPRTEGQSVPLWLAALLALFRRLEPIVKEFNQLVLMVLSQPKRK